MARLAIQGHPTRGREVIALLEMLGGHQCGYPKEAENGYWFININRGNGINAYDVDPTNLCDNFIVFTLEEFEAKFPYKVGDKVKCWINGYCSINTVKDIQWDGVVNEIKYKIQDYWYSTMNLQPYKEETVEDKPNLLQQLKDYFDNTPRGVIEKEWHEYDKYNEISPKVNEYLEYVNNIRQHKYPKTYEECCEILKINYPYFKTEEDGISASTYKNKLFGSLKQLLISRDAYWKIAGEKMGLGKPWEPDLENEELYCIQNYNKQITISRTNTAFNKFLIFPTEEMRDAFYENFKKEIEQCKELL